MVLGAPGICFSSFTLFLFVACCCSGCLKFLYNLSSCSISNYVFFLDLLLFNISSIFVVAFGDFFFYACFGAFRSSLPRRISKVSEKQNLLIDAPLEELQKPRTK